MAMVMAVWMCMPALANEKEDTGEYEIIFEKCRSYTVGGFKDKELFPY